MSITRLPHSVATQDPGVICKKNSREQFENINLDQKKIDSSCAQDYVRVLRISFVYPCGTLSRIYSVIEITVH
jgi:hypothetical protein